MSLSSRTADFATALDRNHGRSFPELQADSVFTTANANAEGTRVLIVDAEQTSAKLLRDAFVAEGYEIAQTASGAEAIILAISWRPTMLILDINLPDIDGREVIRILRKHSAVGIIALSVRDLESEKIAALDLGANDFVCKPAKLGELMARVRAALRVLASVEPPALVYEAGRLTIDAATHTVTLRGQPLRFTSKEFDILHILAAANGRVVAQRHLLETIWGSVSALNLQHLRVFIGRLRKKIEVDPEEPKLLMTERGVGYRLQQLEEHCPHRYGLAGSTLADQKIELPKCSADN